MESFQLSHRYLNTVFRIIHDGTHINGVPLIMLPLSLSDIALLETAGVGIELSVTQDQLITIKSLLLRSTPFKSDEV